MSDKGGLRLIVFTELADKVVEPAATPCALNSFSEKVKNHNGESPRIYSISLFFKIENTAKQVNK